MRKHAECFSPEEVLKRVPLLKRIVRDVVLCYETRRKSKERLEELIVISRKFNSPEIEETVNNLRRKVSEHDRALEEYEKEIRALGGSLKDPRHGLVYFYSPREGVARYSRKAGGQPAGKVHLARRGGDTEPGGAPERQVFLVWDLRHPDQISWHELSESFADRTPVEFTDDRAEPAVDSPDRSSRG